MSLVVVGKLIGAGRGLAPALVRRAHAVALDWDTRQKSRFEATDSAGRRLGVFLPRGRIVRGGDVLVGEDGALIRVEALAQPILVATPGQGAGAALALAKAAYHLGNRHVPLEVQAERLVLEPDHVLAELLVRMGMSVVLTEGPFEPEAGAYEPSRAHDHRGHEHGHVHGHVHEHGHGHGHGHDDLQLHAHDRTPARLHAPGDAAEREQ